MFFFKKKSGGKTNCPFKRQRGRNFTQTQPIVMPSRMLFIHKSSFGSAHQSRVHTFGSIKYVTCQKDCSIDVSSVCLPPTLTPSHLVSVTWPFSSLSYSMIHCCSSCSPTGINNLSDTIRLLSWRNNSSALPGFLPSGAFELAYQ